MPYALEPPENFLQILQRVWWRLDRALDEDDACAPPRSSAAWRRCSPARRRSSTTTPRRTRSTGRSTSIAEALATLGVRSVLCYETSDRDGPERAAAGLAENRRFLERVRREQPPLARGLVGAHASFTLSDETLAACADAARELAVGLHIHAAEDAVDERDAVALTGVGVAARLARAGALDERTLLAHGVHLDDEEIALVRDANASRRPQRPLEHEQRGRARARRRARAAGRARDRRDRLGHVRGVARRVLPAARGRPSAPAPTGRSQRLAEGARFAGARVRRAAARDARAGRARPTSSSSTTRRPRRSTRRASPGHWVFGLSARARPRRDGRRRVGRARPAADARRRSRSSQPRRARRRPSGCGRASTRSRRTRVRAERRPAMAVAADDRVALYLQDKHPIRDGMRYAQLAEERGFEAVWQAESRLVREATVPMAAFAAVTERIGIGSGVVNTGRATSGCSPRRSRRSTTSPRAGSSSGIGAWWDPLASKVGIQRRQPRPGDARDGRGRRAGCSRWSGSPSTASSCDVDDDRDRHRPRRPLAEARPDLHRRDDGMKMMELAGEIGDGVLLNYLVGPGYNREAMEHLAAGAERAGPDARRRRPAAARRLLARRRPLARARPARELVAQYLGQQPHIGKASGVDAVAARGDRRGSSPGRRRRRRSSRRWRSSPTTSSS